MPAIHNAEQYAVFWPRSPRRAQAKPSARRLQTLNGKTIAQLWDYMFHGDEVFNLVEIAIKQRFPDVRFLSWREFGNTHGSDEREVLAGLPKRFKDLGVDAAISAMGC